MSTTYAEAMAAAVQAEARRLLPLWEEATAPLRPLLPRTEMTATCIREQARTIAGAEAVAASASLREMEAVLRDLLGGGAEAGNVLQSWARGAIDRLNYTQKGWAPWAKARAEAAPAREALEEAEAEAFLRLRAKALALLLDGHLPSDEQGYSWILHPDTHGVECQENWEGEISLFPRW